jgi:hypothetical protein
MLTVGQHPSPFDGACVMEIVSQTLGERWGDAPCGVHPLLGHLARLVNDTLSDRRRDDLLDLVPVLVTATDRAPVSYPRLALTCTERALATRSSVLLGHLHRVAAAELAREARLPSLLGDDARAGLPVGLRMRRALFQRGPAVRAVEASVAALLALPQPTRDAALFEMLQSAIDVLHGPRVEAPG